MIAEYIIGSITTIIISSLWLADRVLKREDSAERREMELLNPPPEPQPPSPELDLIKDIEQEIEYWQNRSHGKNDTEYRVCKERVIELTKLLASARAEVLIARQTERLSKQKTEPAILTYINRQS